ncbi:MAG: efflux RND transporter periplasmic adaptor subunit [Candidatus Methylomirabilales bacterium]
MTMYSRMMKRKSTMIMVAVGLAGSIFGAAVMWYVGLVGSATTGARGVTQQEESARRERHSEPRKKESEHAGEGEEAKVHLELEQIERLGIRVDRLKAGSARATITRPATVAFDLDRVARVGPRITAKVVRVTKDLGAAVKKGEVVAVMNSVELGLARTRYLAARGRLETERTNHERQKILHTKGISSEASMLEAKARFHEAEANLQAARETLRLYGLSPKEIEAVQVGDTQSLSSYYLTSPIEGVVQRRDLAPGATVEPNETPIHVVDTSRMWVIVDAFERDTVRLAPGQEIELRVRSLPGRTFRGRINWVSQELKKDTRTLQVRAVMGNADRILRAGMFGTARIYTGETTEAALVPVDAVQTLGNEKVVFVPGNEPGSFEPVPVALGEESDGLVEIISGVQPGSQVVTEGAFALKSALTARGRSAEHAH